MGQVIKNVWHCGVEGNIGKGRLQVGAASGRRGRVGEQIGRVETKTKLNLSKGHKGTLSLYMLIRNWEKKL